MSYENSADLSEVSRPRALQMDARKYMEALSDLDLSEDQKVELLTALWSIMRTFVELGVSADRSSSMLRRAGLLPPNENEEGVQ